MNLNEEVLCGHLVTAEKKKVNAVYLDLLQEFDRLCRKAGIKYWIFFGSLLGTVRHKGFIPWDDDVDIVVPRKDFDRLYRITNEEFGVHEPYFMQNPRTDPSFPQRILRFRRSDTSSIMEYDLGNLQKHPDMTPYNMGLALAIFPLDNLPKSKFVLGLQQKIAGMGVSYRTEGDYGRKKPLINLICRISDIFVTEKFIVNFIQWMYRICRKNRTGMVQSYDGFYPEDNNIWHIEDYDETIYLPFEDILVPVPAGYDRILTAKYNDYMKFPPIEQRVDKHGGYLSADIPYTEMLERIKKETCNL